MNITHNTLLVLSKSFGLFWLMGLFIVFAAWTYRPSRRSFYERVARAVLSEEEPGGGS